MNWRADVRADLEEREFHRQASYRHPAETILRWLLGICVVVGWLMVCFLTESVKYDAREQMFGDER